MRNRDFYRLMEIVPGFLSWFTIFLMFFLSWIFPVGVAVFIILFDVHWLFKTIYLSLHLRHSFNQLKVNLKIDWLEKLMSDTSTKERWKDIFHLVILPMYREPYEVVKESFDRLVEAHYPLDRLIVVLATEKRAWPEAGEVAGKIESFYANKFFSFLVTTHPQGLRGEIPGKGSNETWAIRQAKSEIIDKRNIDYKNILVSVFDVDTQIYSEYFGVLTYKFLTTDHPYHSSYQPVPLFLNNIYQAPTLARIVSFSSTFWHLMQQSREEKLQTFSSHAVPFQALAEVNFWQTDIVSEDSRIFWQLYFHYNGNWRVVPLFYPVSMDVNAAPTFWQTLVNLYKQQRRWAWGCENVAFIFSNFLGNKNIPLSKKWYWGFYVLEGYHSWATHSLILFALGWLPIFLGGEVFDATLLAYNLPYVTRTVMLLASFGIVSSAVLSMIFLPPRPAGFKRIHALWYFFSWVFLPITLIAFGSIPALEAQTRLALSGKFRLDFWVTPKHRFVS